MNVSVIIPIYSAAPFLDKSIQSALNQKQTREVLLIDDRSTDGSLEICKRWEMKDHRVRLFENDGSKGAGAARNVGLRHAICEYIAFLDADDYYLEGRFDEDESLLKTHSSAQIICNKVSLLTLENQQSNFTIGVVKNKEFPTFNDIFNKNGLHLNGLVIQKNFLQSMKINFDESLKVTQDAYFILNLFCKGEILVSNKSRPIAVHVRHIDNTTNDLEIVSLYFRLFAKKSLLMSIKYNLGFDAYKKFVLTFIENCFPKIFNKYANSYRKMLKLILLPYFIILFFKLKV